MYDFLRKCKKIVRGNMPQINIICQFGTLYMLERESEVETSKSDLTLGTLLIMNSVQTVHVALCIELR